jgi:hypothetical protein
MPVQAGHHHGFRNMALIDCPECGGQVSERAPTCPHCGVPIAAAGKAAAESAAAEPEASAAQEYEITPQIQEIEPWKPRLAGRRIPVALLFWGGMIFGVIQHFVFPTAEGADSPMRAIAFYMIFAGILWFAVTEFIALIRSRRLRRMS